jgi:hypothetical protein
MEQKVLSKNALIIHGENMTAVGLMNVSNYFVLEMDQLVNQHIWFTVKAEYSIFFMMEK